MTDETQAVLSDPLCACGHPHSLHSDQWDNEREGVPGCTFIGGGSNAEETDPSPCPCLAFELAP